VRRQLGLRWISALPSNLYGPGDNFDLETAHVLPALIRRFHEAVDSGMDSITLWGSGMPRREFLHVDDLAEACLTLLEHYDDPTPINIGTGHDISIRDLALMVAEIVGFTGRITWDTTKPDGTPRKLLDVSRVSALGWRPRTSLHEGLRSTYVWYEAESSRLLR
jgi:GDP-L-fucose synthase